MIEGDEMSDPLEPPRNPGPDAIPHKSARMITRIEKYELRNQMYYCLHNHLRRGGD
jgi:hypothetical protein